MPCRDDYHDDSATYSKAISILINCLCVMCKQAENNNLPIPPEVLVWWEEHKAQDERHKKDIELKKKRQKIEEEVSAFFAQRLKEEGLE